MIHQWIIPIMGFRQSVAAQTGMEKLWQKLRRYSTERTSIMPPMRWDEPMEPWAEFISRMSPSEPPLIFVASYSWGCGQGFITLAKALQARGMDIHHAFLCDPVYRSTWMPTWLRLNPLSLTGIPTITVPGNVRRVSWVYQQVDKPAGHRLVGERGSSTIIEPGLQLHVPHRDMDESDEYHAMVLDQIGGSF